MVVMHIVTPSTIVLINVKRTYAATAAGGSGPPVTVAVGSPLPPASLLVDSASDSPIAQGSTPECSGVTKMG